MRSLSFALFLTATALAGCTTFKPPQISCDDPPPQPAVLDTEPPKPVQVVEAPRCYRYPAS